VTSQPAPEAGDHGGHHSSKPPAAARQRYEFGQKVSVTTSNRGNWIVGVDLCKENPCDGHTLAQAIATVERTTGVSVTDAYVDKGYRGHDYKGDATIHISGTSDSHAEEAPTTTQRGRTKNRPPQERQSPGPLLPEGPCWRCRQPGTGRRRFQPAKAAGLDHVCTDLRAVEPPPHSPAKLHQLRRPLPHRLTRCRFPAEFTTAYACRQKAAFSGTATSSTSLALWESRGLSRGEGSNRGSSHRDFENDRS
jgi:hypothetical protein